MRGAVTDGIRFRAALYEIDFHWSCRVRLASLIVPNHPPPTMSAEITDRHRVYSIIKYIESLRDRGAADAESLEVAMQCLRCVGHIFHPSIVNLRRRDARHSAL